MAQFNLRPHLNGNTHESIDGSLARAHRLAQQLSDALREVPVHGRNYQHLAGIKAGEAQHEDSARIRAYQKALTDLAGDIMHTRIVLNAEKPLKRAG